MTFANEILLLLVPEIKQVTNPGDCFWSFGQKKGGGTFNETKLFMVNVATGK